MEHFRRENLLFESYIIRNTKDLGKEDEIDDKKVTKKKKEKNQEKKLLSNEEKYEIANYEAEILKKNIEEGRIKSDAILETLRVPSKTSLFWRKPIWRLPKSGRMPSTSSAKS